MLRADAATLVATTTCSSAILLLSLHASDLDASARSHGSPWLTPEGSYRDMWKVPGISLFVSSRTVSMMVWAMVATPAEKQVTARMALDRLLKADLIEGEGDPRLEERARDRNHRRLP